MLPTPVFNETLRVRAFETDFRDRWKPHCVQQALQDAAAHHASLLGFGYPEMFARGLAWVLSRMRIDFDEMPPMGAAVELRTWPKGVQQRLFFTRDFTLHAVDGRRVAAATSAWVLVDRAKRRVLPPSALPGDLPFNPEDAIPDLLEKIAAQQDLEGLPVLGTFQAGYSAVDPVGHANSARYVEWLMDCFPFETYHTRRLSRLQINFSTEVKPGERVAIAAGPVDGRWLALGTILESGVRAFEAHFTWKPIE